MTGTPISIVPEDRCQEGHILSEGPRGAFLASSSCCFQKPLACVTHLLYHFVACGPLSKPESPQPDYTYTNLISTRGHTRRCQKLIDFIPLGARAGHDTQSSDYRHPHICCKGSEPLFSPGRMAVCCRAPRMEASLSINFAFVFYSLELWEIQAVEPLCPGNPSLGVWASQWTLKWRCSACLH